MATKPELLYPGKITPGDTNYPNGSARDITTTGDGTGTPWRSDFINEWFGFNQAILRQANIEASGDPETSLKSQYLEGIKNISSLAVPNIDALRLVEPTVNLQHYNLLGHTIEGIGGGLFYYDENDTTSADNNGSIIVTTSGARLKLIPENGSISSAQFGALDTLEDNHLLINSALNFGSENGISVDDTGTSYNILRPVRVPANSNYNFGSLVNTNTENQNQMLCLYLGNYHPAYFSGFGASGSYERFSFPVYSAGAVSIDMTSTEIAENFSAGDVIFIRSEDHYLNGSIEHPIVASVNRVISVDGATIRLEEPMTDGFVEGWISKANNDALGILGDPLYICSDSVIRGDSLESVNGNCFERGGMYKSSITVNKIKSLTGVFTNLICFSEIIVNNINVTRKMFDLAGNSNSSFVRVNSMTYGSSTASNNVNQIALNENCVSNKIEINNVNTGDYSQDNDIVFIGAARKNEIRINSIESSLHSGNNAACVQLISRAATSSEEAQIRCEHNKLTIASISGGAPRSLIACTNDGGGVICNNIYIDLALGNYSRAIALAGNDNVMHVNSSSGNLSTNGATNNVVTGYIGGWMNNWGEYNNNDFSGLTSDAHRDAKAKSKNIFPITVINSTTAGQPDLATGSINDGTLLYDVNHASNVRIIIEGDLQGGSATKTIQLFDDDGAIFDRTFATNQTGQFTIDCTIFVTSTNRYDTLTKTTFAGTTTHTRVTRTGLADFEREFSINSFVGSGGGIVYRNASIDINP